jgi:RND family efflux transporter MFP subunit
MKRKLNYTFAAVLGALFLGGLFLTIRSQQPANDDARGNAKAPQDHKINGLRLDRETQARIGLQVQPLQSATIRPEVTVYGTLEADPSEEFVLRSPFTGILESKGEWPAVGMQIAEGKDVGSVQPLFAPMDQIGLSERLASARADVEAANASVANASNEVSRLKRLNAEDQNVSEKAVQAAEAQLVSEQAKLRSAQASVELIAAPLQTRSNFNAAVLQVRKSGQVTEVAAQPGESVQAGQALLRINRFDHLLAQLYVPPGQTIPASAIHATIHPAGRPEIAIPASRAALAGSTDPRYQGQTWLFRLALGRAALRPGEAVTAHVLLPGPATAGVLLPSSAILRFQGEAWVYVERTAGEFVRRMAVLDQPGKGGWLVKSGFAPGERIVVTGAQTLLSEEMKSQLESDEE